MKKTDKKFRHLIEIQSNLPQIEVERIIRRELTFFDPQYVKVLKVEENKI